MTYLVVAFNWYQGLYIISVGLAVYGVMQLIAARRSSNNKTDGIIEIIYDLQNMPKVMRQLGLVTVFTWFAMFSMFIYSTSAVTSFHY
jgi:maltose/moltooligosaccharide transporter